MFRLTFSEFVLSSRKGVSCLAKDIASGALDLKFQAWSKTSSSKMKEKETGSQFAFWKVSDTPAPFRVFSPRFCSSSGEDPLTFYQGDVLRGRKNTLRPRDPLSIGWHDPAISAAWLSLFVSAPDGSAFNLWFCRIWKFYYQVLVVAECLASVIGLDCVRGLGLYSTVNGVLKKRNWFSSMPGCSCL